MWWCAIVSILIGCSFCSFSSSSSPKLNKCVNEMFWKEQHNIEINWDDDNYFTRNKWNDVRFRRKNDRKIAAFRTDDSIRPSLFLLLLFLLSSSTSSSVRIKSVQCQVRYECVYGATFGPIKFLLVKSFSIEKEH